MYSAVLYRISFFLNKMTYLFIYLNTSFQDNKGLLVHQFTYAFIPLPVTGTPRERRNGFYCVKYWEPDINNASFVWMGVTGNGLPLLPVAALNHLSAELISWTTYISISYHSTKPKPLWVLISVVKWDGRITNQFEYHGWKWPDDARWHGIRSRDSPGDEILAKIPL